VMLIHQLAALLCSAASLSISVGATLVDEVPPLALRQALALAHPEVVRWDIARLSGSNEGITYESVQSVVRLGSRSAVRLKSGFLMWFSVRGYVPGLIAAHSLSPRRPTNSNDWQRGEVDTLRAGCAPLDAFPRSASWRTQGRISRGSPLCVGLLEVRPTVQRGDTVQLVAQVGAVSIAGQGVALADSTSGSRVAVRTLGSGRIVQGTVSSEPEVFIDVLH
jgi:flagella basal body P-ring formation protein FlgA